jgi:tetratricopeptide (TPR) repeat protein
LLQRALSISDDEAKQNASALAICYLNKAVIFRENGNIDDAFAQYKKPEDQHRASGDKLDAGKALLFCGEMHCANADWDRGFESFRSAMGLFLGISNPLWMARAAEHMSRLYATHERWEEALDAMLAAVSGAAESGHPGDQVHFLCLAAGLLRSWKLHIAKDGLLRQAKRLAKDLPEDKQSEFYAAWTSRMGEMTADVEKAVQADSEVHDLLSQAKQIAEREHLHRHLANCLLEEAYQLNQEDDAEARRELVTRAVELLKEDLRNAQGPRVRGQLIGRISALYGDLGDSAEAMSWLRRAGEIFEKSGDVHGLAGFYGALGKFQRARGELGAEIASCRKALTLIEGRLS